MADKISDYGYDLIKTILLAGAGITAIYYINKFFDLRTSPLLIGGVTAETATRKITVDIPEFWLPYQPGDSKDSVIQQYKPNITIDGTDWILTFNPITTTILGVITSYTPEPVRIPLTKTITLAELATRLVPTVSYTSEPVGWNIKFAPFTILA